LAPRILLISDLHLQASRPEITYSLNQFLANNRGNCTSLYILGDLFEAWIGDDDDHPLGQQISTILADFAAGGSQIYLMHGNRDFLLGASFARACRAELLPEQQAIATSAGPVLLMHGDQLCTDDQEYQEFRQLVRSDTWQEQFLSRPLAERRAFAEQARSQSKEATSMKAGDIMDVNQAEVASVLADSGHHILIHGHTHRPAEHSLVLGDGSTASRIVLGSWDEAVWFVEINAEGISLEQRPLEHRTN